MCRLRELKFHYTYSEGAERLEKRNNLFGYPENVSYIYKKLNTMIEIEYCEVIEDNIKAVKDTSYFGGPNMWHLHIQNNDGWFESIQWMSVHNIQRFFNTKLPVYEEN